MYIGKSAILFKQQRGSLFRECLDTIRVQNTARSLFHERHVFNSDRLKTLCLPIIACIKQYHEDGIEPTF
jgi:hypothetical protein